MVITEPAVSTQWGMGLADPGEGEGGGEEGGGGGGGGGGLNSTCTINLQTLPLTSKV